VLYLYKPAGLLISIYHTSIYLIHKLHEILIAFRNTQSLFWSRAGIRYTRLAFSFPRRLCTRVHGPCSRVTFWRPRTRLATIKTTGWCLVWRQT